MDALNVLPPEINHNENSEERGEMVLVEFQRMMKVGSDVLNKASLKIL